MSTYPFNYFTQLTILPYFYLLYTIPISMKKLFAILVVFCTAIIANAQEKAGTTDVMGHTISSTNYFDITTQLDAYWAANTDKDKRGSGYKPYVRWKEFWKYYVAADGSIMSSNQIAAQYKEQRKIQSSKLAKTTGADLSNWIPLGPYTHTNKGSWSSGQGRVNITTIDPNHPNIIYVGSANGGVWRSGDAGNSWIPLSDFLPSIGISGIAIDPSDSKTIYLSTGDEDGSNAYTDGVYKSTDSGYTWTQLSYPYLPSSYSGEILVNTKNSQMLWVVGRNGLYKSTDAGATWVQTHPMWTKEIRQKPNDSSVLYVVERIGTNHNILKSTDAGETFTNIQSYPSTARVVIDVTPADPNYLYVLAANADNSFKGIYRSTDAGLTFTTQNDTTNIFNASRQAYYDLAIGVSDTDPNTIFTGCLDVWKSSDGGATIYKHNRWNKPDTVTYTHADIHDIKFYNGKIYVSSDGGIYVSGDNGLNFSDKTINGLNISQFYRIDVAQSDSAIMVGGLQDNGGFSFANNAWVNFHGADGMDAAINPQNVYEHFGFIQYGGSIYKINYSVLDSGKKVANAPKSDAGDWITPLEYGNGGTLYAGYSRLYRLVDTSFIQASTAFFSPRIKQMRVHPTNDSIILLTNGTKLYITTGLSPMGFKQILGIPLTSFTNIDFNRNDGNILYAIGDSGVFRSKDFGTTWDNITYNLPKGSKNSIIHQASSTNNTLYLAMNKAVYYIDDTKTEWQLYSNNIPNTTISDIEVNNVENHVVISTYGRGVWRTPVTIESLTIDENKLASKLITLYPNPVKNTAKIGTTINEQATLKVFNTSGMLLLQKEYQSINPNTELDFSALASGVYFLTITSEKHLISKKFLKN